MKNLTYITSLIVLILICTTQLSFAGNYTWTGNSSTAWNVNGNWNPPTGYPTTNDTANIETHTNNPVLDATRTVYRLKVTSGILNLNGYTLTASNTSLFTAGTVTNGTLKPEGVKATFTATYFNATVVGISARIFIDGGTFDQPVTLQDTGVTTTSSAGGAIFNSSAKFIKTGTHTGIWGLADDEGNIYNGQTTFINTSDSDLFVVREDTSFFNGNIYVGSNSTGSVNIGGNSTDGYVSVLASGKTINIDTTYGFTNGRLLLKRLVQIGTTSQSFTLTSNAALNIANCTFNASLNFTAPEITLRQSVFNGATTMVQTSSTTTNSYGGNTYNSSAVLTGPSSGGNYFKMAVNTNDIYNGNVTISGKADLVTNYNATVYGNLTVGSGVNFNHSSFTGTLIFAGSNNQTITGSGVVVGLRKVKIDKTSNSITIDTTVTVSDTLRFVKGKINTTTTHLLSLLAGSTVTGATDSGFVNGPAKKTGNTAFVFPVGKSSAYIAIEMSAPSSSSDAFSAEYFNSNQANGYTMDNSMKFIDNCNYWSLTRNSGSSSPSVKLNWDVTNCPLLDSASVKVANWNGSTWKDLGNGGITGNKTKGKVVNSITVITYGNFTLSFDKCFLTADAGKDKSVCPNDSITIGATIVAAMGTPSYSYSWHPSTGLSSSNTANPKANPTNDTTYIVTITDASGCTKRDTINVLHQSINFSWNNNELIWGNTYPKNDESHGNSIQQTKDSGYIICGSALNEESGLDVYVLKLNSDGDTMWTRTIEGDDLEEGYCIRQSNDDGYVISGYTTSEGEGEQDFYIIKMNEDGETEWTTTYGGREADISYNILQSLDGGYIAIGTTESEGAGGKDILLVKFNEEGEQQSSITYGTAGDETASDIEQLRDSGFIICGSTASFSHDEDIYIIRTDKNGDTLWTRYYEQEGIQTAHAIYLCEESGFVIAGLTETESNGLDMLMMKIFDDGNLLWQKTFGGTGDEVAYDIKETKNYGFTLVGNTTSSVACSSQDIYLVTTDDFGDMVTEGRYGDVYSDEGRGVCITDDNQIAFTGTVNTVANPIVFGGCVPACPLTYPRGIWFGQCWRFLASQNPDNFMLIDGTALWTEKVAEFVAYCHEAKIHTVILAHLEDIIREDNGTFTNYQQCRNTLPDGPDLRAHLRFLINELYNAGVSLVLAQWLDQNHNYTLNGTCNFSANYHADEDDRTILHNQEILTAFNALNNPTIATPLGFNGLMLDYEYFAPKYGATSNDFEYACIGFKDNWLPLATSFLEAKYNYNSTGVKIVQAYLNAVAFTGNSVVTNNYFNYTNNVTPCDYGSGQTDPLDTKNQLWDIDKLNYSGTYFDAFSIAFDIEDNMAAAMNRNDDPTSFLTGEDLSNGNQSAQQRLRHRLQILGNETSNIRKTKVIPFLRAFNKPDFTSPCTSSVTSFLGDLMLGDQGTCYWKTNPWPTNLNIWPGGPTPTTGDHYLSDIETEFVEQFNNRWGVDASKDYGYNNYGNVDIYHGFQWFQYGLNDPDMVTTTYDVLFGNINRPGDKINTIYCNYGFRLVNPLITNNFVPDSTLQIHKIENGKIYPNPFFDNSTIDLTTLNYTGQLIFKVHDLIGREATDLFKFEKQNENKRYSLRTNKAVNGLYFLTVYENNIPRKVISFSIMH